MRIIKRPDTTVITGEELVRILDEAVMAKTGRRVSHISGCASNEVFELGNLEAQHIVRLELTLHPKEEK